MNKQPFHIENLKFKPVTPARWDDFAKLFGQKGACGGCWCMNWRLQAKEFEQNKGAGNKRAMKKIVLSGKIPGLLAYAGNEPIGWCSVAPRETFVRLERSRNFKPIDDKQVWSIACLFIAKPFRAQGVSVALLKATVAHVKKKGGKIVEGYPVEPDKKWPDAFAWTGVTSAYVKAGFKEVLRRSPSRPIMRCYL
jgi:GNAT superfamily N-acetyltransferase